ncbi:hypothetical protein SAMN05216266_11124 [Amycolatopsis marina]|uniref:Serine/threonine protein kinase n=1 Tax=Amycolatopsis marina TaxID=490629 RepID=A0A1I1B2Q8_9PSEU|nr:hypothetical protein SAMN05216266_11124 [Amycolatopsis marina]
MWIAAGATVVAALITATATLLASSGTKDTPAAVAPTEEDRPTGVPRHVPTSTGSTGETRPAAPTVRWQGVVVFDGSGKDFDAEQPSDVVGGNDFVTNGVAGSVQIGTLPGTTVSTWKAGELPIHRDCADTVEAAGTTSEQLELGTVLCAKTDEGRIARLVVREIPEDELAPVVRFDAVIWSLAGS